MESNSLTDKRRADGASYQLLSSLYYPPDASFSNVLADLTSIWAGLYPELLPRLESMRAAMAQEELTLAFTPLFLGPFKVLALPYGSIYLEEKREVMGASTQEVNRIYQRAGLNLAETSKEAPDHIAVELEFMYYLIFRQCEALDMGDLIAAKGWVETQASFLERHLGVWVGMFAEQIQEMTKSKSEIIFLPKVADDPSQREPDITTAKRELKWKPEVHVKEGLRKAIDYFQSVLDHHGEIVPTGPEAAKPKGK